MKDQFVMQLQIEDPSRGTLTADFAVDVDELNTYDGPLGRIIIFNPIGPDTQFIARSSDMVIFFAQFFQQFSSGGFDS